MQKKKNNADDAETPPLATTPLNSSTEIPGAEVGAEAAVVATEKNDAPDSGHTMLGSAFVVGIMTLISRLTGLWRFRVMGEVFGASGVADAFNFAFIFPNLTRKLFGEGLLTSLFVPVFAGKMAQGEKEAANRTASILLVKLSYWLSLGCVLCVGVSMALRFALASALNLSPERILEFKLFEALLPYCVFINVAAVLMAILNSLDHFWMPAFAPVLLNVAVILACYFGLPLFGTLAHEQIWAVALAVLIGGAIQFLVQLPPAFALGFKFSFSTDSTDSGYREVMDNFKPVALMVAVFQLNVLVDNLIAQKFIPGDGPVTYMNMGTSVYQMAWALIALAIGVAALPTLSRQWAQNKTREFHQTLTTALRYAVFASIPCTIGALLLSEDIVRFLYGTGKFLAHDGEPVRRTSGVVFFSCLGLVFYSVNAILVRALYAMKDMKTPTRTLFHSVLLNLALNLFFVLAGPKIASALYETVKGFALTPQTSGEAITPMATDAAPVRIGRLQFHRQFRPPERERHYSLRNDQHRMANLGAGKSRPRANGWRGGGGGELGFLADSFRNRRAFIAARPRRLSFLRDKRRRNTLRVFVRRSGVFGTDSLRGPGLSRETIQRHPRKTEREQRHAASGERISRSSEISASALHVLRGRCSNGPAGLGRARQHAARRPHPRTSPPARHRAGVGGNRRLLHRVERPIVARIR